MRTLKSILTILVLLLIAASGFGQEKTSAELYEGFDAFVEETMGQWNVPGLAIAVVRDGEVLLLKGYGKRDVGDDLPVTPKTLFAIGSTTKAFTSLALGMLVEEGKLAWDEPVRSFLPEFELMDETATLQATPLDLVNHRIGLPRHDAVWYNSGYSRDQLVRRLKYLEPNAGLRERFQYNNLMFMTAGYLVGQISGGTWEDFVLDRIFIPIGMSNSIFGPPEDWSVETASPYEPEGDGIKKVPHYDDWAVGPAGSIYSSAEDMSRWLLFHLGDGKVGEREIVSKTILDMMHTPQFAVPYAGTKELPLTTYGMGWVIEIYRGHKYVWHNGGIDGFYAYIGFLPFEQDGVVILTNLAGHRASEIISRRIFDRLAGLDDYDWSSYFLERRDRGDDSEEEDSGRKTGTSPSHELADYAGTFSHPAYQEVKIAHDEGVLTAEFHGEKATLEHYHYDVFAGDFEGTELKLTFGMNDLGDINRLSIPLQRGVDPIVFERIANAELFESDYIAGFALEFEDEGGRMHFEVREDGLLYAILPGQPAYALVPIRENWFQLRDLEEYKVEFRVDAEGDIIEVAFHQPNGVFVSKRVQ